MRQKKATARKMRLFGLIAIGSAICLLNPSKTESVEATRVTGSHIGTFNGSTTFTTTSSNGINPGLFIEVMDDEGNLAQYESEEGVITIPETKEGAYITQAKLLGKTKYVDQDTGEVLDRFEEGRNLELVSSENPVLNTFHYTNLINQNDKAYLTPIPSPRTLYYSAGNNTHHTLHYYDSEGNKIGDSGNEWSMRSAYNLPLNTKFVKMQYTDDTLRPMLGFVEGEPYKPYELQKSSLLMVTEDITLKGIGNVRDTLDLITGEYEQKTGQFTFTDSLNYSVYSTQDTHIALSYPYTKIDGMYEHIEHRDGLHLSDYPLSRTRVPNTDWICSYYYSSDISGRYVAINIQASTKEEAVNYLKGNPVTLVYPRETPTIQTVNLTSDYYFQAVTNQNIQVNGDIEPLVVSIMVPTDVLTFTLDSNQEAGQQFIAPDFTLMNETLAPLQIELKSFEQTTNVLNDVLPDKYDTWEGLNQKESKDIALALVSTPSDGWLTLDEGPRYVVNTSNDLIGTVKGKSTVEFSFHALHGRAFSEVLNPQYRLTFVFGFNQ